MCGIFGIASTNKDVNKSLAIESLDLQEHRGPDQHDYHVTESVFIGHRRLSIHDLSEHGKQPMTAQNVYLTVNGEVYNFRELREELKEGYCFNSDSDSEVILKGYLEWGIEKLVEKLEGMYAIQIYDSNVNKCYLIRDRVGIKPLYYYCKDGLFLWSSEIKSIVHYIKKDNLSIDKTALYDFLTYLYVPHPKTIYTDIRKLEPGNFITIDFSAPNLELVVNKYWDICEFESNLTFEEALNKYDQLLFNAVTQQLDADVEVSAFLSGGLDSSSVVSIASKLRAQLKTFTIGFDDPNHDESNKAKQVSEYCNTDRFVEHLDADYASKMSSILSYYDEPFGDTSFLPTYRVSELARDHTVVVLSGDGGDELFGGYNWYSNFELYNNKIKFLDFKPYNYLSTTLKKFFKGTKVESALRQLDMRYSLSGYPLYTKLLGGLNHLEKTYIRKELGISEDYNDYWFFEKYEVRGLSQIKQLQYIDFKTYLPCDILTKVDIATMRHSLECRVPFLDTKLCEFAFSLPQAFGYSDGVLKRIVKESLNDKLPKEIVYSKKRGFSIPQKHWKNNPEVKNVSVYNQFENWKQKL